MRHKFIPQVQPLEPRELMAHAQPAYVKDLANLATASIKALDLYFRMLQDGDDMYLKAITSHLLRGSIQPNVPKKPQVVMCISKHLSSGPKIRPPIGKTTGHARPRPLPPPLKRVSVFKHIVGPNRNPKQVLPPKSVLSPKSVRLPKPVLPPKPVQLPKSVLPPKPVSPPDQGPKDKTQPTNKKDSRHDL